MNPGASSAAKPADLLQRLPPAARILLVRLRSLGDTVLSTPLYTALKRWRPDLRLTVLVEPPSDGVLTNNPDLEDVISVGTPGGGVLGMFAARLGALKRIRGAGFDCCINLHGGVTSAWMTALSGARHRVGASTFRKRFAYNAIVDITPWRPGDPKPHTVEYQMGWLHGLGLPRGTIPPLRVVPDPDWKAAALGKLRAAGLDAGKDYAVIQPASRFHTKEWRADGFAAIADAVHARHGLQAVLLAGPGEEEKARRVARLCQPPPVVVESVSVAELIWIIQGAKLFVGNDSGPTHIAAALQIPIVVLFGSSDSRVWYPWQAPHQIIQNSFECNPCHGRHCAVYGEPRCILSIAPEQVQAAVDVLLRRPPGSR